MTKPANENAPQIEAPAKVTNLHVQDRTFRNEAGQIVTNQAAWRKLSPLEAAYAKNQLAGGSIKYTAQSRFEAGKHYEQMFALSESSGKDSTQAMNISRSMGHGSISENQAKASSQLITIHGHMGARDRAIVMLVCGKGHFPSEAVREVCGDYRDTVAARFREALDGLIEAMESARRHPGINLRRKD